jgi:uncharacterized protein YfaS (alpha-2-macroglobulin family)
MGAERVNRAEQMEAVRGEEPTQVTFRVDGASVYRGESVTVRGRLTSGGRGLEGQQVVVVFGHPGGSSAAEMRTVGRAETDAQGAYRLEVTVPKETEIGRWRLMVRYPGSEAYEPAVGE